jgi:hypothetical protein
VIVRIAAWPITIVAGLVPEAGIVEVNGGIPADSSIVVVIVDIVFIVPLGMLLCMLLEMLLDVLLDISLDILL